MTKRPEKTFISADALLIDSIRLAKMVYEDGFFPDIIVGLWRGGAPIAVSVHEYFCYRQRPCDHIPVRVSSYGNNNTQRKQIDIDGLDYLIKTIKAEHKLLLVDDVFDSGRSLEALLTTIRKSSGSQMAGQVKTACPWYKPNNARAAIKPDYYLHTTDQWLVFPHELMSLTTDDIKNGKGEPLASLLL